MNTNLFERPASQERGIEVRRTAWHPRMVIQRQRGLGGKTPPATRHDISGALNKPNEFPPTHWTLIGLAGQDSTPDARKAFGALYEAYRHPLFVFLCTQGRKEDEANDLLQGFIQSLLENRTLGKVRRTGRFRSWLLVCLKRYVSDVVDREKALKRGGGAEHMAIRTGDDDDNENSVEVPIKGRSPDQEYDRQFAITVIAKVISRLESSYTPEEFELLQEFLYERIPDISHAEVARRLGMSEGAVATMISRMRKDFRKYLADEVFSLVDCPEDVAKEIQELLVAYRQ